jgi:hypothetical protein
MSCPHCKTELRIAERQGVEVDYCPDCRGIWLDRGELDRIVERSLNTVGSASAPVWPEPASRGDWRYADVDDDDDDRHRQRGAGYGPPAYGLRGNPRRKRSWLGELLDFD